MCHESNINILQTNDREMSLMIATAYIIVGGHRMFHLSCLSLKLPPDILKNLKGKLPPFVEALLVDGYSQGKTQKTIFIGNTGKHNYNIYTIL